MQIENLVRSRELAALNRRKQVCLKLQEIALATRDEDLLRKADDLSMQAWALYLQRTGGTAHGPDVDERILDRHLDSRADAGRIRECGELSRGGQHRRRWLHGHSHGRRT